LFDEPLSNLDAKLRVTTRAELKRLHHRLKTTTIYVTHDQEEAMTLGDRIVVMKDGVIQQADPPLRTYNYPANRFVAGFIGMPPMNFFDGALKIDDGKMIFEEGSLQPLGRALGFGGQLTLPGNGFRLGIPRHLTEMVGGSVGKHVVLGIRPEHLSVKPPDGGDSRGMNWAPLSVKLNVIEPLGSDMDVYMSTALNESVVGRVEAQSGLQMDTQVTMYVDLRKVHVFEPGETGMNLSKTSGEHAHALA
jgi:multiple sugar transport system ATP-binding protein